MRFVTYCRFGICDLVGGGVRYGTTKVVLNTDRLFQNNTVKICIYAHVDGAAREYLAAELAGNDVLWVDKRVVREGDDGALERFVSCDIAFGNVPAHWLEVPGRLRWLQLESVGFEYYQHVAGCIAERGLVLTNLRGMFARPAAETALAGLLALLRGGDELALAQRERRWVELEVRPRTGLLHGKRVLVCGGGSIGRRIAAILQAFECGVEFYSKSSPDAQWHTAAELDAALACYDIVINALPSTPETKHLFSRERLSLLGRSAIFVNVGRGSTVDEPALVDALMERRLGGAVLDVFHQEPLPEAHPLWNCPRTIITQHTGGGYVDELLDKARLFVDNYRRFLQGESLKNRVNLKQGY